MDAWRVRAATAADAPAIATVQVLGWQQGFAGLLPADYLSGLPVRTQFWSGTLEAPPERSHVGVAVVGDQPGTEETVGFCAVGPVQPGDAEDGVGQLYAIYLLRDFWGHGLGHALHVDGMERLRTAGFTEAVLWVLRDNDRTIAFYQRQGWRADGATRDDEVRGAVLRIERMRLSLTAR